MVALQSRRDVSGSKRRAERAKELVEARVEAPSILRDHVASLCDHRPHNGTLWSTVADLGARRIAYAPGAPCRAPFQPVAWPSA